MILGLHVKALLLRRRFRKQKARVSHAYTQALFDARTAAREKGYRFVSSGSNSVLYDKKRSRCG